MVFRAFCSARLDHATISMSLLERYHRKKLERISNELAAISYFFNGSRRCQCQSIRITLGDTRRAVSDSFEHIEGLNIRSRWLSDDSRSPTHRAGSFS